MREGSQLKLSENRLACCLHTIYYKHLSVIAPFSLYVPSTFLTLIGVFNMLFLHLCAMDLSMNKPSALQSTKVVISSVFSTVSTLIGMENRLFEIDHTVT